MQEFSMALPLITYDTHSIFSLPREIHIGLLPTLTPQFVVHIQQNNQKHIVLDFTDVHILDPNATKLFVNLQKRIQKNNCALYFLRPSPSICDILKHGDFADEPVIIDNCNDLQTSSTTSHYEHLLPYTYVEGDMLRVRYGCGVCGSPDVIGYLIDQNTFSWKWLPGELFPSSIDNRGEQFDLTGVLPIVCPDCFMSSINSSHFNVLDEKKTVIHHSALNNQNQVLLSKTMKKRKKLMEIGIIVGDHFFMHPRNPLSCYYAYALAESCLRTVTANKNKEIAFSIAYMDYCALQYAEDGQKDELITSCRTWLTQVIQQKQTYSAIQLAKAYFMLLVINISLGKTKEAAHIFQNFSLAIKKIPHTLNAQDIHNPWFWYNQAEHLWQSENEPRSSLVTT